MARPNLSHLTQAELIGNEDNNFIFNKQGNKVLPEIITTDEFRAACLNIPNLVQLAEMLYDITLNRPEGMMHQIVKEVLNDLAK